MIKRRLQLVLLRLKWRFLERNKALKFSKNLDLYNEMFDIKKEVMELYNVNYRQNPTKNDTVYYEGQLDLLTELLGK